MGKHISNNMVDTSVEADYCALTEEENAVRYVGGLPLPLLLMSPGHY